MRLRASLHCVFSTLMCFLNERCESHHSHRNFVAPSTGRSVSNPHRGGSLSPRSVRSEMYDFALVGCKPETIPGRPFLYCIYCLLQMSLYGVQGAPFKTDRQVINKECSKDVPDLINFQSKTYHSQDITSWNTFLWLEFDRECCPNSDSDSPVLETFWQKQVSDWNMQSLCRALTLIQPSCGLFC